MREIAANIGPGGTLVAITTVPGDGSDSGGTLPAVVLLNSGLIHRVGPNRLYVKLARALAAEGFVVTRLDLSGIGDSAARTDSLVFEKSAVDETQVAMQYLREHFGARSFVLGGICSGADVAFMTARESEDVIGAVLINGQSLHGVAEEPDAQVEGRLRAASEFHYLLSVAIFRPSSWLGLLRSGPKILSLLRTLAGRITRILPGARSAPPAGVALQAEFGELDRRKVRLLLLYSEGDAGLEYLSLMLGRRLRPVITGANCDYTVLAGADHTFTLRRCQDELAEAIRAWARRTFAGSTVTGS